MRTRSRLSVSLASLLLLGGLRSSGSVPDHSPAAIGTFPSPASGWSAGVARVRVTPTEPIFLKGYGSRTRPSEGIQQDLFVKALALKDRMDSVSVLVTSDLHS